MNSPNDQEQAKFKFDFKEFISFRQMITLRIIQILYIVVAIVITIFALFTMFKGDGGSDSVYGSMMPGGFFGGLTILIFGNLGWRVYCELMIVLFRMNKSIGEIENNTRKLPL